MKYLSLISFLLVYLIKPANDKNIHCYIFIAEECPISIYMTKPLKKAMESYSNQVDFYAVFPKKNSTNQTAKEFLEKYDLPDMEIVLDADQSFAKKTEATITPEAIITDSEGTILYRGRISDAYSAPGRMKHGTRNNELIQILKKISAGENVSESWKPAIGCYITFH